MTPDPNPPPGDAPADQARTVIEPRESGGAALPVGVALQEFVIEGLVGEGGFGIVYLARDTQLGRQVALKEYMPTNLAQRGGDRGVTVRSERHRETFALGLRSFVNEAKLLASFDHPSLVKVYRFWEENGTAYMVMPFYEGPTLREQLQQFGQPPDEAWLRTLLAPLIDALELIHNDHCWHRDIAPDNILLLAPQKTQAGAGPQLRPLLLDFGAARRVIGDVTHNLTVILKPGYAPIEQYAESDAMRQGPWTDVYALCAVLYGAVTGRAPVPSVSRVLSDEMVSAAQAGAGRYSAAFLDAVDSGLAVRPDARPQSMAALRERFGLGAGRAVPAAAPPPAARPASAATAPLRPAGAAATALPGAPAAAQSAAPTASGGAAGLSKWVLVGIGSVALVIAAAAIGWGLERGTAARRAPAPQAEPPSATAVPQAPAATPALAAPGGPAATVAPSAPSTPLTAASDPAAPALATPAAALPATAPATPPATPAVTPAVTAAPPASPKVGSTAAPTTPSATAPSATPAPARAATARASAATTTTARIPPAKPSGAETAPVGVPAAPAAAVQAAPPALDPKRFECDVLVRAGQKALANRSYDDAMQRADEAQAIYTDCPGAVELGRNARQAKDRARSAVVIQ